MKTQRRILLLAVEAGGDTPTRAGKRPIDTVVVVQRPTEPARLFAQRLVAHIRALRPKGMTLERAEIACNERTDSEAIATRVLILRTILTVSPHLIGSDVRLTSAASNVRHRHQFEAILQAFSEHEHTGVTGRAAPLSRLVA